LSGGHAIRVIRRACRNYRGQRRRSAADCNQRAGKLNNRLSVAMLETVANYSTQVDYSVRRIVRDGREVRDFAGTRALAEFLGELGFNAYQDLGFETVLLVEGPTDVTTVQQLLRLYQKEHKIVLLPLGGSSMINAGCESQLAEITRISQRVYALIDSERSQPDKGPCSGSARVHGIMFETKDSVPRTRASRN